MAGIAVLLVGVAACCQSALARTPHQVRLGSVPQTPHGATVMGALPDTTKLNAVVELKPSDPLALTNYAQSVSTPGSADYHQYLTVDQFRQRFGPTAATVTAVEDALQAEGLTPGKPSANGMLIPVSASAGALAQAFDTSFDRVQLSSGRVAYANTEAPSLPQSVSADVEGVAGLDSLTVPQSQAVAAPTGTTSAGPTRAPQVVTGGPQPCTEATDTPHPNGDIAYTADQIASAYDFEGFYGAGDEGAGQTIGLLEMEPNLTSDISAFKSCYGVGTTVNYIPVDGGSQVDTDNPAEGSSAEAALDIEQVIGLAPQATVDVFQGPDAQESTPVTGTPISDAQYLDLLSAMVTYSRTGNGVPSVNVISTSWGICEPANDTATSESYIFEEASVQGQSVYAAAGDDGSEDCDGQASETATFRHQLAVDDPGTQPYVTSVGGTSLPSYTAPTSQTVWNNAIGAGGGGISAVWAMPSWQANAAGALGVVNSRSSGAPCGVTTGDCREVPDVSADADPDTGYAIYYDYGWNLYGGTSAGAPLWAAYTALVNASADCNSKPIGFASPLLYEAAASSYAADFTDITAAGSNDFTGTNNNTYPTADGYDMATGLGTPVGGPLGTTLCNESDVVSLVNPGNQSSQEGGTVTPVTLSANDIEGRSLTYSTTPLPAGLTLTSTTHTISGIATTAGVYTVTATATSASGKSASQTFTWTVESTTATVTQTTTQPAQTITRTTTDTVTQPATTVTQPAKTVTQPGSTTTLPGQVVTSTQTVTTPPVTRTITTPTKTVTVTVQTPPPTKTQTISVNFGNQALKLTTPLPTACTAGTATYDVSFSSTTRAGKPKLKFKSIAYYLDKGIEQAKRKAKRIDGHVRIARVTTYKANVTSTKASGTAKLKLGSLKSGTHTLKAIVTYSEGGKTVTKTLTTKLKVC